MQKPLESFATFAEAEAAADQVNHRILPRLEWRYSQSEVA
ncbi:MAG: hypothetical protein ACJASX_004465 [Limisphaerales bacterium]